MVRIMAYVVNFQYYKHFYRATWFYDRLIQLHKKGVIVRMILDSSPHFSLNHRANFFTAKRLTENGIQVKMQTSKLPQHSKLIIIDDLIAFTGSHNLTEGSLTSNLELSFGFQDPMLVSKLILHFDAFWLSKETARWERRYWPKSQIKASPQPTAITP